MLTPATPAEPEVYTRPAFETLSRYRNSQDRYAVVDHADGFDVVPRVTPAWHAIAGGTLTALIFGAGGGWVMPGRWWTSVPVGVTLGLVTWWLKRHADRAAADAGPCLTFDAGRRVLSLPRQNVELLPERLARLQLVTFGPWIDVPDMPETAFTELQLVDSRDRSWLVAAGIGSWSLRRAATDLGRRLNLSVEDVNVTATGRNHYQKFTIKPLFTPDGKSP